MNQADRDLLIEIRVEFPTGGFEVSTGYPVQRDLILTARHGLHPKNCPPDAKIKLRFFHQRGDVGQPIEVQRQDIVWEGEGELDAALIRCDFPKGLADSWRYLSTLRPPHGESWASEGFPLGFDADDQPRAFPLDGTLHGAASDEPRFHLNLPANFKIPKDWGGVSGAPVFVRGQIAGIILTVPENAQGRLVALYSAALFNDSGFADRIGYSRETGRIAALQAAATACLQNNAQACEQLGLALGIAETEAKTLVGKLIGLPTAEHVIKIIKKAHKGALSGKDSKAAAATLRQLSLIAMPACFNTQIVESLCQEMGDYRNRPVLKPKIGTRAAAELAMSAADGQPSQYREHEITGEFPDPHGVYCLNQDEPPLTGIQGTVDDGQYKTLWMRQLFNKFAKNLSHDDPSKIVAVVNRRMQVDVDEDQPRTHYVLLTDADHEADNAAQERRAGLIRADFPSLVFLRLDNKQGDIESETALLDPLFKLLAKTKPQETDS